MVWHGQLFRGDDRLRQEDVHQPEESLEAHSFREIRRKFTTSDLKLFHQTKHIIYEKESYHKHDADVVPRSTASFRP